MSIIAIYIAITLEIVPVRFRKNIKYRPFKTDAWN